MARPYFQQQTQTPKKTRTKASLALPARWFLTTFLGLFAMTCVGCGFDPAEIDERRCKNNDACESSFGLGWKCVRGYCQERACESDFECDDGIFCNGRETCDPDAMGSGPDGCVSNVLELDDGIECTRDFCDEVLNVVRHDPAGCPCTGDRTCQALNDSPCLEPVCENFACVVTAKPVGTPCDDGISCTQQNTCNASGACQVGEFNNAFCSELNDGFFCNGEERCEPGAAGSDPVTGCVPGTAPTPTPEDDNIACTEVICDDVNDIVFHAPTEACGCQTDQDCDFGDCNRWICTENFECVPDGQAEAGKPCDDGFACTRDAQCDDAGVCVGFASDLFCELNSDCSETPTCDPASGDADGETGCVCPNR